jgi:hypothetical protein
VRRATVSHSMTTNEDLRAGLGGGT